MSGPCFGDLIENLWASEKNPRRFGTFVRARRRTGRMNPGLHYELTDRNGKFWEVGVSDKLINHGPLLAHTNSPEAA